MSDAPVTKVVIETPPLSVTVEAPGVELAIVRMYAVEIYRELYEVGMRQVPLAAGGMGFIGASGDLSDTAPVDLYQTGPSASRRPRSARAAS